MTIPVLVVLGQSNAVLDSSWYKPRYQLIRFHLQTDPVHGWIPLLADLLCDKLKIDDLIWINLAQGSTCSDEWVRMATHFTKQVTTLLHPFSAEPTWVLWQHGEGDAGRGVPTIDYISNVKAVASNFPTAKFYVPLETCCKPWTIQENQDKIRLAQAELGKIFNSGPDFDVLGDEYRSDCCHFNEKGMRIIAKLWADLLV